jgi:hypothetical protein
VVEPRGGPGHSGRKLVVVLAVLAAATLATVLIRERNKKTMFAIYADVHNLAMSQEAYFADSSKYAGDLGTYYAPTHGATVRITWANDTGWAATATHPATSRICTITYAHPRGATTSQVLDARTEAWKGYACK